MAPELDFPPALVSRPPLSPHRWRLAWLRVGHAAQRPEARTIPCPAQCPPCPEAEASRDLPAACLRGSSAPAPADTCG